MRVPSALGQALEPAKRARPEMRLSAENVLAGLGNCAPCKGDERALPIAVVERRVAGNLLVAVFRAPDEDDLPSAVLTRRTATTAAFLLAPPSFPGFVVSRFVAHVEFPCLLQIQPLVVGRQPSRRA